MSVTVLSVCDTCPNIGPVYPHPQGFWRVCRECYDKAAARPVAPPVVAAATVCPACEGNGQPYCPHCRMTYWEDEE